MLVEESVLLLNVSLNLLRKFLFELLKFEEFIFVDCDSLFILLKLGNVAAPYIATPINH